MKRTMLTFILLIFYSCENSEAYRWEKDTSFETVLSKSNGKIILLDFETEWCGWCKKLDENTYSDENVKNFGKTHLLSMKIDAEKGEGIELAKRYNVRGFPTIVFTNNDGEEIDRIVGYRDPIPFLNELRRVQSGRNTLPSLLQDYHRDPEKFSTLFKLAKKYEAMGDQLSAKEMIDAILSANVDSAGTGKFFEILYDSKESQDPRDLIKYINNNEGSYLTSAIQEAMYLVRKNGNNPALEADLYLKLINYPEEKTPSMLNTFAWRMSELEMNLDVAINKVNEAIVRVKDKSQKYMFIDTKAEILWKLNKTEDAIVEIKKCINFEPDNKYYQEQLEKFKLSIKA